jgi:hypothetical protein
MREGALAEGQHEVARHGRQPDPSGGYLSPISEPAEYLAGAATRFPDLLADAILGVPAELALTWAARPLAVVGVVAALLAGLLLRDTLRRATDEEGAAVRWLLPGALVAAFAAVGGFPGARELVVPSRSTFVAGMMAWSRSCAMRGASIPSQAISSCFSGADSIG